MSSEPWLPSDVLVLERLQDRAGELRQHQRELSLRLSDLCADIQQLSSHPGLPEIANQVPGWAELAHRAAHALGDPTSLEGNSGEMRLKVAFVGRTEAGKSTLVNALLRKTVAEVGDGHQRTTRGISTHRCSPFIDIIDTPGVAAVGGEDDEALAAAAAQRADLLVYVISSDQFGGQEAKVLSGLDEVTTPCHLVLNLKHDVDGRRKGRDAKAKRRRFLESPESFFVSSEIAEHAARIAEAAPRLWQRAGERLLPLHALSASMSLDPRFEADAKRLLEVSRIADLESELDRASRRWIPGSRIVGITQPFVAGAERSQAVLGRLADEFTQAQRHLVETLGSKEARLDAIRHMHEERFRARVARALEPVRRDIPKMVESDGARELTHQWEQSVESAHLEVEFREGLEALAAEIEEALASPVMVDNRIEWRPPSVEFDVSIDMGEIIIDALLDGIKDAGIKGISKLLLKRVMKRGAAGAAGGPVTQIVLILVWVLSIVRKVHLGRKEAKRRNRIETTKLLRSVLDRTEANLPRHFRRHVEAGNLGTSIARHQDGLAAAAEGISAMEDATRWAVEALESTSETWVSAQVTHLEGLWSAGEDEWPVRRSPDGSFVLPESDEVPWAGLACLAHLTGVTVSVEDGSLPLEAAEATNIEEHCRVGHHGHLKQAGHEPPESASNAG